MAASDGATDAQVRDALRDAGVTVGARGRISDEQYAEYERLRAAGDNLGLPAPEWPSADLDGDQGAGTSPAGAPAPEFFSDPVIDEQRPRAVKTGPTAGDRARSMWGRRPKGDPPPKGGQKGKGRSPAGRRRPAEHPWRPTAGVIETIWTRLAMSSGGIPPLQRILAAQAPMSGIVLEAQLRGSFADRVFLQPAARMEAQTEAVTALFGVPLLTMAIAARGRYQLAQGPDGQMYPVIREDGTPVWSAGTEGAVTALKYCLMSWLAVSERHAGDIIAQAEATVQKGKDADAIIAWIFGQSPPQSFEDLQREAAARAAGFAAAQQPPGPPEPPQARFHEGPPPSSSAFLPALTGSVLPR